MPCVFSPSASAASYPRRTSTTPGRAWTRLGVNTGQDVAIGALPTVSPAAGWLRDPQRFPVIIRFSDDRARGLRREGGQSDVIIYTGGNWVINSLGWISIRIKALLSYLY